jgi:hypothetical protein
MFIREISVKAFRPNAKGFGLKTCLIIFKKPLASGRAFDTFFAPFRPKD